MLTCFHEGLDIRCRHPLEQLSPTGLCVTDSNPPSSRPLRSCERAATLSISGAQASTSPIAWASCPKSRRRVTVAAFEVVGYTPRDELAYVMLNVPRETL